MSVRNLQPAFLVGKTARLLGLLPAFVGVLSVYFCS
jgi:hypothetical protein